MVVIHTCCIIFGGFQTSTAWPSWTKLVVPTLRSTPVLAHGNTSGGVTVSRVWKCGNSEWQCGHDVTGLHD